MEHSPQELHGRILELFRQPMEESLPALRQLVIETLDLVQPRFPEIKLAPLLERLKSA